MNSSCFFHVGQLDKPTILVRSVFAFILLVWDTCEQINTRKIQKSLLLTIAKEKEKEKEQEKKTFI
jgi:hypothetical protein